MTEEHIHVRLDNALGLRKSLLEAALVSTEILHSFEEAKEIGKMSEMFRKQAVKMTGTMVREVNKLGKKLPGLPGDFAASTVIDGKEELVGKETEKYKIQDEMSKIREKLRELKAD